MNSLRMSVQMLCESENLQFLHIILEHRYNTYLLENMFVYS